MKFLPHFHFWTEIFPAVRPDRRDWFCQLRHCRCGEIQYNAFALCGDKKWHNIEDKTGCMWDSEHEGIVISAVHHGIYETKHQTRKD